MTKLKCYFAHPYKSRNTPEEERLIEIIENRNIEIIGPFKNEDDLLAKHGVKEYYEKHPPYKLARTIWINDLTEIRKADIVIFWIPFRSMGTGAELQYALGIQQKRFKENKPYLIQIITKEVHPLIAYALHSGNQLFRSIDDFDRIRQSDW
jgi:nucleoside 2-deoxyribosyltransferase